MKKSKEKSYILPVLFIVPVVILCVMLFALLRKPTSKTADFTPPPFDNSAQQGTPNVPEELGYSSPYKEGMAYRFSICGNVTLENGGAVVYLTNAAENQVWLKVRIIDESGKTLGESGLIKPNEYVRSVPLDTLPNSRVKISLKIMGYEPETYRSAGSVTLNTTVGGKSK